MRGPRPTAKSFTSSAEAFAKLPRSRAPVRWACAPMDDAADRRHFLHQGNIAGNKTGAGQTLCEPFPAS